jgi:hypothetical protein
MNIAAVCRPAGIVASAPLQTAAGLSHVVLAHSASTIARPQRAAARLSR